MNVFFLSLIAVSNSKELIIESQDPLDNFLFDLFILFSDMVDFQNQKLHISTLQKNSPELSAKVNEFVLKYRDKNPSVNQLNTFFKKLTEIESFYLIPNNTLSNEDNLKFYNHLLSIKENKKYEEVQGIMDSLFKEL